LKEGADISQIIQEAHNDFRISNERVYRFIQFLSTLKEIRKVELSFGGDYVFEILVDYKGMLFYLNGVAIVYHNTLHEITYCLGLLALFDTEGRDFGPSYDVNDIIEKSKLFTMHQPFGDEMNIKDDIHNYVDILNDEVILGIEVKPEIKEEIKVSPLEEFYMGPVFDLALSQLFEMTGNKLPQFWTRIFTILNKPMNLVEEGKIDNGCLSNIIMSLFSSKLTLFRSIESAREPRDN
jgi:hypothetical protein